MNQKNVETTLIGAICLIVGWGASTIIHECGHIAVARSLGLPASFGMLTLTTGSVFVSGDLTGTQTALIAVAGSLLLIIAGVLMVRLSRNPAVRLVGVVFLVRAWVDAIPSCDLDGGLIAGSAGYAIAMTILLVEILICGSVILNAIPRECS